MGGPGGNMMMMGGGPGGVGMTGTNPNPNPSDEEIVQAIRSYLSTQDLMRVTKRSAREAISNWFPKSVSLSFTVLTFGSPGLIEFFFAFVSANLGERKAFVNEKIDSILAGN